MGHRSRLQICHITQSAVEREEFEWHLTLCFWERCRKRDPVEFNTMLTLPPSVRLRFLLKLLNGGAPVEAPGGSESPEQKTQLPSLTVMSNSPRIITLERLVGSTVCLYYHHNSDLMWGNVRVTCITLVDPSLSAQFSAFDALEYFPMLQLKESQETPDVWAHENVHIII